MKIRQFEHLLAIAESKSFRLAAERFSLTQSALSRSIQSLEEEIGVRLIDRIGRRNELTSIGEVVVSRARALLDQLEQLQDDVGTLKTASAGSIRIGMGSGPGAILTAPLLVFMAQKHPNVCVTLTKGTLEMQILQLRARQLDAIISDIQDLTPAPDLDVEYLAELRAGFICRAGHPLHTKNKKKVGLREILNYPLASPPLSEQSVRTLVRQFGSNVYPEHAVRVQCEDVVSVLEAVRMSDAIFLGVTSSAQTGMASGQLVELKTDPQLALVGRYAIVKLARRTESPVMAVVRQFIFDKMVGA